MLVHRTQQKLNSGGFWGWRAHTSTPYQFFYFMANHGMVLVMTIGKRFASTPGVHRQRSAKSVVDI